MTITHGIRSAPGSEQALALKAGKANIHPEFMEDLRVSSYSALLTPSYVHEEFPMVSAEVVPWQ